MTPQKNQRLKALPNVLRNQTVPNRLGGRGADSGQVTRPIRIGRPEGFAWPTISWKRILSIIIGLLVAASLLAGRP